MAVLIGLCSFATLFAQDKNRDKNNIRNIRQAVVEPLQEFFFRNNGQNGRNSQNSCNAVLILLLILTYKLGEALSTALTTPLLIKTLNFTTQDVGLVFKTMGTIAVLVGLSIGGGLINRLGLYASLFWFGTLQALSILLYLWLLYAGHNYQVMAFTILIEQFSSGISTAAFMVLLMAICNQKYTATQFALFSALASVGRVYASPVAGYFVAAYGWEMFFVFSFLMCLPSLFILKILKKDILNNRFGVIIPA
jgi:PAT family beta-lactamase induction signal transducer AmpG